MTARDLANRILDRVREGEDYPARVVTWALTQTGDLPQ